MNFATLKALTIPEGNVVKITQLDGNLLWHKSNVARIPDIYQEVEFLGALDKVGTYIDLGFSYNLGATIHIGQTMHDNATAYLFGAAENSGALRCLISSPYSNVVYVYGSTGSAFISIQVDYQLDALNDIWATYKAGAFSAENKFNADKAGPSDKLGEYTMTNNLYLFAQNYNGSARFGGLRQIHYFQYFDKDGKLICDLIPCYRKSDGEAGMYDLVSKNFFTNVGDGAFVVGPAVNVEEGDYVNLISEATDDTGAIYNGTGYKDGARWSSNGGAETATAQGRLSGWLPYKQGATYRFKNFGIANVTYAAGAYVIYKKTNGSFLVHTTGKSGTAGTTTDYNVDPTADICTFTTSLSDVECFRISGNHVPLAPIVTMNQEIS